MNIHVDVKGLKETMQNLSDIEKKHLPFATAKALTNTAQRVQKKELDMMKSALDRPTPFTLNSLQVTPATKSKLEARVWVRTPTRLSYKQHYLEPNIIGGSREPKAFEKALRRAGILPNGMAIVPGAGAQLDSYGNMSRGQIVQILSYFKAFGEQGYRANITDKRKAKLNQGTKRKTGYAYFVIKKKQGRLSPGIYKLIHLGHGNAIKPVMIFVNKSFSYRKRWEFYEIGQAEAARWLDLEFKRSLEFALRTAK